MAPLIVNWTGGVRPCKTSLNTRDWFNTLMSLFEPATVKYACQIQKSYDATISSIIMGFDYHLYGISLAMQLDKFCIPNACNQ